MIPSITILLLAALTPSAIAVTVDLGDNAWSWLNNNAIQSLIGAIFDQIDHIDIVIGGGDSADQKDQADYLVRHGTNFRWKSVRFYEALSTSLNEEGCAARSSIPAANSDFDSFAEYEDVEFVRWTQSYESFVKIWNQNQRGGFVIFCEFSIFEDLMSCLLDPAGTYLVVLKTNEDFILGEASRLMESIWKRNGVYRLFMLVDNRIYTFDPFVIDGYEYGAVTELVNSEDIPALPQKDFKGYPFAVDIFRSTYSEPVLDEEGTIVDFLGPDVEVSRAFTKAMNLTPYYITPDKDNFGVRLSNGTFNGVIGRISRHESDVSFVGFFIKDYFSRDMEFTSAVYTDEMCCLVKKASRVPEYLLPVTIFPADLWALLFLMGLLCSAVWIALRAGIRAKATSRVKWIQKRRLAYLFNLSSDIREAPMYRKMIQICVDTYILLVSGPYQRFTRSGIERLMLFGLLMVSLIFVSMFQSSLSSVFLNPVYYKDINSLEQLDHSGFKIPVKYKGFMDDVFPANYSPTMDSLRSKMMLQTVQESMLARVARLGSLATVTRKTTLSLDNAIYLTTKQLYMIPECPRLYNLAYVVPRHSVFLERINVLLSWMLNGGLINHWVAEMNFNVTIKDWDQIRGAEMGNFKILTLIDMQFPFYLLFIGTALSAGVFAVEQVHFRLAT